MGFLSGLTSTLTGGSSGKNSSTSQSGFALLPQPIQDSFTGYANNFNNLIPGAASAFTPIPQTQDETNAFNTIRQGFAPTADSLKSDVGMLMNPFNDSVINQINQQANGNNSILKQTLSQNGALGSNRQVLGANDIENTRESNIGSLLQNQYNQAIGQVFNNLIPQREQDTQNLLGIGNFQRQLASSTSQAPYTALLSLGQGLSALPQSGGSTSNASGSTSSSGGLGSLFGGGATSQATGLFNTIGRLFG